jgi:hypothetical protein
VLERWGGPALIGCVGQVFLRRGKPLRVLRAVKAAVAVAPHDARVAAAVERLASSGAFCDVM